MFYFILFSVLAVMYCHTDSSDFSLCVINPFLAPAIITGASSLLGNLFGGLFSSSAQKNQFEQQKELMKFNQELGFENMEKQQQLGLQTFEHTFGKEASLNSQLMSSSPAIQKRAMIDAGVNPASQFGSFSGNLAQSSAPTYTPQGGTPSAPSTLPVDFSSLANLGSNIAGVVSSLARARKDNADAVEKERDNRGHQEEDAVYSAFQNYFDWKLENGKLFYTLKDSSAGLPEVVRTNLKTKAGVRALQLGMSDILKDQMDNMTSISQSELAKKIAEGQLNNNVILSALTAMPAQEYNKIVAELQKIGKETGLLNLQYEYDKKRNAFELPEQKLQLLEHEIKEKTNIYKALERFTSGNWDINDLIYGIFTLAAASVSR